MSALAFQLARQQFFEALRAHGYGAWIGKPLEEKSFELKEGTWNNENSISRGVASSRNGGAIECKVEEP